jgi:ketoreductase RED2
VSGEWSDKVVLVTGSTSGIGEATARLFAQRGAHIVLNSSRSVEAGEKLASELPSATYVQGRVAGDGDAEGIVSAAIERFGRLDVLVNNAATTRVIDHRDLKAASPEVWREIFEVNVLGTWAMCVAAMDHLRATSGAIVNITSYAGIRPNGSSIPYATSKAALNHVTVLLAKVVGPHVRVNAVAPGLIDTPWTKDWELQRNFVSGVAPLKRTGQPGDVAQVVVATAASAYMTGQVVVVDGGLSITT